MGVLAADGPAVGLDHDRRDAAAPEDVAVGQHHALIGLVQRLGVGVEAVGVLHVELAHADQAAAGAGFVAELGLDLVYQLGEVAVALQVLLHQQGHGLLVRGGDHQFPLAAVLQPHQVRPEGSVAARLHPQLAGLERGQLDLLAAGGVHLVAHDGLDFGEASEGERGVGVHAGGDLLDHAGAQHQPVVGGLGLRGVVAQGLRQEAGQAHGRSSNSVIRDSTRIPRRGRFH